MLTAADRRYIEEQFVPLEALCAHAGCDLADVRRRIAARELPSPPCPGARARPGGLPHTARRRGVPAAGRFAWCAELRSAVDELDVLERPFSPDYDRRRFGVPPTRDELIDGARRRFPQIWSAAA